METSSTSIYILLADDDRKENILFQEVLADLPVSTRLSIVATGEELMQLLTDPAEQLPDLLFLDLNMPRKSGFDCLSEIKSSEKLKPISVVIFSTSYESDVVTLLYNHGAEFYIRRPNSYSQLKKIIQRALLVYETK